MASLLKPCDRLLSLRKNLTKNYPFGGPSRTDIPGSKIPWNVAWEEYNPPWFTTEVVLSHKKPWCDPEITNSSSFSWNQIDGKLNRISYEGNYKIDDQGYPLNPVGRTGLKGRGNLGRWGPNHAVDPIVTRWKKNSNAIVYSEDVNQDTRKPILQFIAIQRRDNSEWAIPGGMLDEGEEVASALKREFLEEVFDLEEVSPERKKMEHQLGELFSKGNVIYNGYVDDRRNTDNAWIETTAVNFHLCDEYDEFFRKLKLKAGSDAKNAAWTDVSSSLNLYASHSTFLKLVVDSFGAYW